MHAHQHNGMNRQEELTMGRFAAFMKLHTERALRSTPLYARHVERHHQGSSQDSEAGNHVPRGFPGGGSDHEETPARQAGAALRRRV